jgi:predicted metal-dependent phosphoesterase TrpH
MVDLHLHSTFSDGSLTPAQLVEQAGKLGLTAIALTDHDTTAGNPALRQAARGGQLKALTGVEISVEFSPGTLHMLAYCLDTPNEPLQDALLRIRGGREDRNQVILQRLNQLGLRLTMEEVASHAGDEVVGRPHFAQAMLAKGYVKTTQEAFDSYLAKGKPAYMDRLRLGAAEAIALIRGAGGVPVLAHPFTLQMSSSALEKFVAELVDAGLQGIEAYYSEHTPEQEQKYLRLARTFRLAVTGGSDFHGAVNPDVKMGVGFGSLRVPEETVDQLYERAHR